MLTFDDLAGFAPVQRFPDLPHPGFDVTYGVEHCDIGEDGEILILGHVGKLRALAVFRSRMRYWWYQQEADRLLGSVARALARIEHRWAVRVPRCATYPMCGSLGPVDDGKPCHDDFGVGYDDHDWSGWSDRPEDLIPVGDQAALRLRWCDRCNLYESEPSRRRQPANRCVQCREIDECGDFYIRWDATPATPGAFPITLWRA